MTTIKDICSEHESVVSRIKELHNELYELKKQKAELEEKIQNICEERKVEGFACNGIIYRNKKTTKKKALGKKEKTKNMLEILEKHLDQEDVLKVYDEIVESTASREEGEVSKIVTMKR